jgi:uncharacterized membrane protein YcaP (DUF421 family)
MDSVVFIVGSWEAVARVLVVGTLAYFALVLLIRAGTKRSLAQFGAFDFVITVALGSAFGRILTATEVGIVEAVVTFGLLVTLQYVLSLAEMRSPAMANVVKAPPSLLYYEGRYLEDAMRRELVTKKALESAVRQRGLGSFDGVEAIVLESGGDLAVILEQQRGDGTVIDTLR